MDGPWEKFSPPSASNDGPWTKFQTVNVQSQPSGGGSGGIISSFVKPITSLPGTYSEMVHGAEGEMVSGLSRAGRGESELTSGKIGQGLGDIAAGGGQAAIGGANYVTAPINAPIRTFIGKPTGNLVQSATGSKTAGDIAQGIAEMGAAMMLPLPKGEAAAEAPSVEALKAAAESGFNSPVIEALQFNPQSIQNWSDVTRVELGTQGIDSILAPKTWGILDKFDKIPEGSTVSGKNIQTLRRTLGKAASLPDATERLAAKQAIDSLDTFIENPPPKSIVAGHPTEASHVWKEARGNYAAAKHAEMVQDAVERAELYAGSAHSGQNIDNATRQRIRDILKNPKERRGFTSDEVGQMEKIVKGTWHGDIPRFVGNLLGGGGGLGSVVSAAAGAAAAGPAGAGAPLLGYAFKKLGNFITARRVQELQQMIRARSPLAEQMRSALVGYSRASLEVTENPSIEALGRLLTASQGLSDTLNAAGLQTTPHQLSGAAIGEPDSSSGVNVIPFNQ